MWEWEDGCVRREEGCGGVWERENGCVRREEGCVGEGEWMCEEGGGM